MEPTGFRCTESVRLQLQMAVLFMPDQTNLQSLVGCAVQEYLSRIHRDVPGYREAVAMATQSHAGLPDNVTRINHRTAR